MSNLDYYLKLLTDGYRQTKTISAYETYESQGGDPSVARAEYISDYIFEIVTYDATQAAIFVNWALKVCDSITNRTTFDFINKSADHYIWYLIILNLPFFKDKIEWGGSIRGAWWATYEPEQFLIKSCGLYEDNKQILELQLTEDTWPIFLQALHQFLETV